MKICINLIRFSSSIQGIEIFTRNIILNLLKIKKDEEFFTLCMEDLPESLNFPKTKIIEIGGFFKKKYIRGLYQQFNIYYLLKKYKIDIFFSPYLFAPIFYKNKIVVIHDCAYNRFREESGGLLYKIYVRLMFYGAKYFSKKIITDSNFSKKELIELYKIDPKKIEVIYGGVPELPEVNDEIIKKTLKKFKIDKPYFFYVGGQRPHKNLLGLIEAFKIFQKNYNFLLVIGGKKDKTFLDLEKEIKKIQLEGKIILTDTLSREEIVALYKKTKALTFPSFYEGFGLPILEAQSLGAPVLTSNTSSLPEVAGDAALYVNPYSIEDIAKGMGKIAFNESLRKDLIQRGYENIKRFSWQNSARQLLNLFHTL